MGTRGRGEAVPARAPGGLSARDLPAIPFVLLYLFGVQCGNAPAQPVRREARLGPGPPVAAVMLADMSEVAWTWLHVLLAQLLPTGRWRRI